MRPTANLGIGIGLRTAHFTELLERRAQVDWFEAISENFMMPGGRPLHVLDHVRRDVPIVLHGVSLSIGSTDPLDHHHLGELRRIAARFEPAWVSDHLCWTGAKRHNLHDLLPLPWNEEALAHVTERVKRVQDALGRRIALENVSSYLRFTHSTMSESAFLAELAERADCWILLDVNNVYVSAFNHGFDAREFIDAMPADRVIQLHLAGHTDLGTHRLDTHDAPICREVWDLYAYTLGRLGPVSTLIEWDGNVPPLDVLEGEVTRARAIWSSFREDEGTTTGADRTFAA